MRRKPESSFRRWLLAALLASAVATAGAQAQHVIYTKENAPPSPRIEDLQLRESISQYGITWTFDQPVRVGQFVTGDWYVVGPATVVEVTPGWDGTKNGSVLNVPPRAFQSGFDARVRGSGRYKPELTAKVPIEMKPGDTLVSSVGRETPVRQYPVESIAILTCLKEPVPADAFRPGYCDRDHTIYLARHLRRDLLPRLALPPAPQDMSEYRSGLRRYPPKIEESEQRFARPWLDHGFFEADQASYQRGGYGRAVAEEGGRASLLLMLDFEPEEKEGLLIGFVQYGLDLWGLVKSGHRGWVAHGGWGSGRKWPIVFAGIMLGDDKMARPTKSHPDVNFQEDRQTMYDDCWTGAGVVYSGHIGHERTVTDRHVPRGWGPYEHLHPSRWTSWIGTSYRGNMTSNTWVAQALAIRIMQAEEYWNYAPWLDYCDRWMTEPDPGYRNPYDLSKQGHTWDPFFVEMWKAYRNNLPAIAGKEPPPRPTDGWKKEREMKSVAVAIGENRGFRVGGRPFFPLMLFAEHPDRIADALAIGANTIAEGSFEGADEATNQIFWKAQLHNREFLDQLAEKGLYGIFGADARVAGHPNLLGWIHLEEPDRALDYTPEERSKSSFIIPSYRVMAWAQEHDPEQQGKHEVLRLVGPAYRWMKQMDATRPVFLSLGPWFFDAAAEKKELVAGFVQAADAVGCAVYPISRMNAPGKLSQVADSVSRLRELAGDGKPVFAWMETSAGGDAAGALKPEYVRAQVWMAVIRGATGIGYRGFEGYDMDVKPPAEMMAELKRLNGRLSRLAPAILGDPAGGTVEVSLAGGAACHSKATEHAGQVYVFAQNMEPAGNRNATIRVRGLRAGTNVEVVDEDRTIVAEDGSLADEFPPLGEHVYRFRQ
jgi:hypothetical protein